MELKEKDGKWTKLTFTEESFEVANQIKLVEQFLKSSIQ